MREHHGYGSRFSSADEPARGADRTSVVRFGPFEIDPRPWELRVEGERVALGPRPVRLLHLLVSRKGELVTRDEIYQLLWPDGEIDVNRGTNTCIRQIRRAIGDRVGDRALIRTYPGRGYRFVEAGRVARDDEHGPRVRWARRYWRRIGAVTALLAAAVVFALARGHARPPTISVLPFATIGADSVSLAGVGIAADLITVLTRIDPAHLRVLATESARPAAVRGAADYVLTGTFRSDSLGSVLTASLVRVHDGITLWADRFQRVGEGSLLLQREIAERIVQAIAPAVIPELSKAWRRDPAPAAREAFLRAGYFVRQGRELRLALSYLDTVIARDRSFAPGHALRADALFLLREHGAARAAAEQALRLDSADAHAHFILGNVDLVTDWRWRAAEAELRRAIDLAPGTALYHLGYGFFLAAAGRSDEAIREAELAVALDPLSPPMLTEGGMVFLLSGASQRAARSCDQALELDRTTGYAAECATESHALAGDVSAGLLDRLARANGADPGALFANAGPGVTERMRVLHEWRLQRLEARAKASPDSLGGHGWYDLAVAFTEAGRTDEALAALQRSAGEHAIAFVAMLVDPRLYALRAQKRFRALERDLAGSECRWDGNRAWRCPSDTAGLTRRAATAAG
jgi:DNA-binding winged helix-turn-helix (wHTH) protein/TolB-like protein/Tfp pilus assembly protein PilF